MRYRSLQAAQRTDAMNALYPLVEPVVHVHEVGCHSRTEFFEDLRRFATGLVDFDIIPSDVHTCSSISVGLCKFSCYALTFGSVHSANRTFAVLNDHPALRDYGVRFTAPGDDGWPRLNTPFTTRIISADQYVGNGEWPRPAWMDQLYTMSDFEDSWPYDAPSPEEVYDYCIAFGTIFSVTMRHRTWRQRYWEARVQYYDVADADKLEGHLQTSNVCDWTVKLESDHKRVEWAAQGTWRKAIEKARNKSTFPISAPEKPVEDEPTMLATTSSTPAPKAEENETLGVTDSAGAMIEIDPQETVIDDVDALTASLVEQKWSCVIA